MSLGVYIGQDELKPASVAALLSVSLLICLFAYLNRFTRRRYFGIWMVAWLFFALWLVLTCRIPDKNSSFIHMARTWSIGVSAVFLFWGGLIFMGRRVSQRLLSLLVLFFLAWSYVGIYHMEDASQANVPIFTTMAVSSLLTARGFLVYRRKRAFIGAGLLTAGFGLWSLFLFSYPFAESLPDIAPTIYLLSALVQLFIGVSMIILVLEEVRSGRASALGRVVSERAVRRELESRVRSSEARFRRLFDRASEAIAITTQDGLRIIELNGRARTLLGIGNQIAADVSLNSFIDRPQQKHRTITQRLDRILPGATINLVAHDGRRNPVSVERSNIEIDGEPAFQFVFREITEVSRLEQQVRQAEKLSALGQMISGVAHELNNPLAIIKGYLDMIQNHPDLPESVRGDLRKVTHESNRAAKLVRSFLSFARDQPAQRKPTDLNSIVESVLELRRFDTLVAQTTVTSHLNSRLPRIKADADQIQQVLVNLINNALHAIVSAGCIGKIVIKSESVGDRVLLRIEDNGPGVPTELRSKIFEPFFTTKEPGQGTGLGLSIAHGIMTEHAGDISYMPSALGGAAFILNFPAAAETEARNDVQPATPFVAGRNGRVLVLDDEAALAEMVGQMLSFYGHEVTVCSVPTRALDLIHTQGFDAIISDYRMPVVDGREFHARVRQQNPELARRIIFLTGDVVSEETKEFFQSVANPRLTKPFQLETVARAVNDVLLQQAA